MSLMINVTLSSPLRSRVSLHHWDAADLLAPPSVQTPLSVAPIPAFVGFDHDLPRKRLPSNIHQTRYYINSPSLDHLRRPTMPPPFYSHPPPSSYATSSSSLFADVSSPSSSSLPSTLLRRSQDLLQSSLHEISRRATNPRIVPNQRNVSGLARTSRRWDGRAASSFDSS